MKPFDLAQDRLRGIRDVGKNSSPDYIRATNLLLIWSASEAEEWHNQLCFLPLSSGKDDPHA